MVQGSLPIVNTSSTGCGHLFARGASNGPFRGIRLSISRDFTPVERSAVYRKANRKGTGLIAVTSSVLSYQSSAEGYARADFPDQGGKFPDCPDSIPC